MNELFKLLLKLSISGSIFFLLFYILSFFTQRILSAKWHYKAIKFNMIFFIFPIVLLFDLFTKDIKSNVTINKANIIFNEMSQATYYFNLIKYLFIIWILGVVVISIWKIYCYKRFNKNIYLWTYEDEELEAFALNCKNILNVNSHIEIKRSSTAKTPMVIGILNPTVIIPKDIDITPELEPIIIHELIHIKRNDLLFKAILLIITTIYWFNPIVYIINNSFEKWCEISCDEIVSQNMCYEKRKKYGNTILNIIEKSSISENTMCFYLCNDKKYIKRRLRMMLNNKKDSKAKKIGGLILIATIIIISAKFSILTTTSNSNLNNSKVNSAVNLIGKSFDESTSIINENSLSIEIESTDEGIKKLLESEATRIKNEYKSVGYKKCSIVVIDIENNNLLGKLTYNKIEM